MQWFINTVTYFLLREDHFPLTLAHSPMGLIFTHKLLSHGFFAFNSLFPLGERVRVRGCFF